MHADIATDPDFGTVTFADGTAAFLVVVTVCGQRLRLAVKAESVSMADEMARALHSVAEQLCDAARHAKLEHDRTAGAQVEGHEPGASGVGVVTP